MKQAVTRQTQVEEKKMTEQKTRTLDLEVLAGKLDKESLKKCDTKHTSALDHYHPVRNLLYGLGIKDNDRFIAIVNEGVQIIPSEEQKEYAGKYLDDWLQLIQDAKSGKDLPPYQSCFGPIKIKYDREDLNGPGVEGLRRSVKAICAIAQRDSEEVIARMLE